MLYLYQSNRLECLAELLNAVVKIPLSNPFAVETVVVPSKGMGRWISLALARRNGICANVAFPLPASFLWQLLQTALGELPKRSPFAPEILTWRIMALLGDPHGPSLAPALQAYLAQGDDYRRFELASRIADIFDHYQVYRPDWIAGWEEGRTFELGPDESWQQTLWQALTQDSAELNRARLMERLFERLNDRRIPLPLPERIVLFGLTSAPPVFLEAIKALSERTDVCLFALNPCRQTWGEILDHREIAHRAGDEDADALFLDVGNPLLASLGKQGRAFFDQIQGDFPDVHDLFDDQSAMPGTLLDTLQRDVLDLIDRTKDHPRPIATADRSLQIHVCHSPMREVEVLHDQLLALFDADPDLQPGDVAVLVPDISAYAPLIEAVFAPRDNTPAIPYGIADRGLCHEQPLLERFVQLLDLPHSRFQAEEIMGLLDHPAVMRRFDLCGADLDLIHHWVGAGNIRWGRDREQKRNLDLTPVDLHTWRQGLRRIMLGYALPVSLAGNRQPLFKGLLPYDDLEGGRAQIFGRFTAFVETLFEFADVLARKHTLPQWADRLSALAGALFFADDAEENSFQHLRATLDLLRDLSEQSNFQGEVGASVVKSWLSRQWQQAAGTGGFLTGGVTFCNLVPMRSLPFKTICLLGMNDGDFPRQQRPPGFDLISRHPRCGDRSRRFDDRYLLLETLLSARHTLYISYVGRSVRDNSELPPSVLVADLMDVVKQSCILESGGDILRQVVTHHPLQPFSPAYYRGDKKLPGYSDQWLAAARLAGGGAREPLPLLDHQALPEAEAEWLQVDLETLIYFYTNPARFLLRKRLGIDLHTDEVVLDNREPFALDYFDKEAVRGRILQALLSGREADSAYVVARAEGLLPHGGFGQALYRPEQTVAESLSQRIQAALPPALLAPVEIHFQHDGIELNGWLDKVGEAGYLDYRLNDIKPRDYLQTWLKHLTLCLTKPSGAALRSRLIGKDRNVIFTEVADPEIHLQGLLALYRQGLRHPLPVFVKSSFAYAESFMKHGDQEKALQAAHKIWDAPAYRNGKHFGESENAYYQAIYRGTDPLDDEFCELALEIINPMLTAMATE